MTACGSVKSQDTCYNALNSSIQASPSTPPLHHDDATEVDDPPTPLTPLPPPRAAYYHGLLAHNGLGSLQLLSLYGPLGGMLLTPLTFLHHTPHMAVTKPVQRPLQNPGLLGRVATVLHG